MDLTPYLSGGAAGRADSLTGMNPAFSSALASMFAAAPQGLTINSGYRSPELQAQLWQKALAKYGSAEAARKWVAPPGRSQHGAGNAADLGYLNDAQKAWVHANAANYGLAFPLSNEPWHVELAGARGGGGGGGGGPTMTAAASLPQLNAPAGAGPMTMPMNTTGADPAGMMLGDVAAQFLQNHQARMQQRQQEQAMEEERRRALFDVGGLGGLYA